MAPGAGQDEGGARVAFARRCFLRACTLDVAVRKPGNVSLGSPGHGMEAPLFTASASAASGPLFEPGRGLGDRLEAAVRASWSVAGCNTNLGILLLCGPMAMAFEQGGALRSKLHQVLGELDVQDTRAAYRAIAHANPGGLGRAEAEDVHTPPTLGLRDAMSLAADRDRIARQYRDGFAELFDVALPALGDGFALLEEGVSAKSTAAVQRLYLVLLATWPDSHIVRKHGEAVAQNVMSAAQGFLQRQGEGEELAAAPEFIAWDEALKAEGLNPGTTADFTVAALMLSGLVQVD